MSYTPKDVAILVLAIVLIIALYGAYKAGMLAIVPHIFRKLTVLFDNATSGKPLTIMPLLFR